MSFVTASYYDTGSYISGTTDNYSSGNVYTVFHAAPTFIYAANVVTGSIENYSSGGVYTVFHAPPTINYNASIQTLANNKPTAGQSPHAGKPSKL